MFTYIGYEKVAAEETVKASNNAAPSRMRGPLPSGFSSSTTGRKLALPLSHLVEVSHAA
jgi:hypothetical protein